MELSGFLHLTVEHGAGFDFIFSHQNQPYMNKHMILKSDILDIIFEKRNKLYGAYDLRKFYPTRLKTALGFMFITTLVFSAFTLIPEKRNALITKPYIFAETELKKVNDKPKEPEQKAEVVKAEKKPDTRATPFKQVRHTNNVRVVAKHEKSDTVRTILSTDVIASTNVLVTTPGQVLVEPVKSDPGSEGGQKDLTPKIDKTAPMDVDAVDVLP